MTETELRTRMTDTARRWLGLNERDGSFRVILDIYNAHRPLARGHRLTERDPWCAGTVSALAIVNGLTGIIPTECSCGQMIRGLQALDAWQETDSYLPRPGDLLFYDWDDRTGGRGENFGAPDHVGLVETAEKGGMTVIEGNRNGAVARRTLSANGRYIRGFGVPDYGAEAASLSLWELARAGVLDSPERWRQKLVCGEIRHLGTLLCKAAGVIRTAGPRTETPEAGLARLVEAGVVNRPDHWAAVMAEDRAAAELMRALGGAVGR